MIRINRGGRTQEPLIVADAYGLWYGIYKVEKGYEPNTLLYYYRRLDHDDNWR